VQAFLIAFLAPLVVIVVLIFILIVILIFVLISIRFRQTGIVARVFMPGFVPENDAERRRRHSYAGA
jgi:hypothetical protein